MKFCSFSSFSSIGNRFVVMALVSMAMLATGCLQTRTGQKEVDEKQVIRSQVSTLQKSTADLNVRFQDIDEEFRRLNGRIEVAESKVNQLNSQNQSSQAKEQQILNDINTRLAAYQEAISKLDTQVAELTSQMASLQDAQKQAAAAPPSLASKASGKDKNPFELGEESFAKSDWKEAILNYEKYRKTNPKGKSYGMATYKIGVSFQELGLSDDARVFFEEVVQKFPKSEAANKATYRLKNMKK